MNAAILAAKKAELHTLEARLAKGWAVIDQLILEDADLRRREAAEERWLSLHRQYQVLYAEVYPERLAEYTRVTGKSVVLV